MDALEIISFVGLAVGLALIVLPRPERGPHRAAEGRRVASLPPVLRRRLERYIERRAGLGAATAERFGLVLVCVLLASAALLFPFFRIGAVLPAAAIAFAVGELYLQAGELRRTARLEEQSLEFLSAAVANLASSAHVAPARVLLRILVDAEAPLKEEVAMILPPLQAGQDFFAPLEEVMARTRSARLARVLHLWLNSEEETLGPRGQAQRFAALLEQERRLEKLQQRTRLSVRKAQANMYVVVGIIPAMVTVLMVLVPDFRRAYLDTDLGRLGLALILGLEFLALFVSWAMVRAALR